MSELDQNLIDMAMGPDQQMRQNPDQARHGLYVEFYMHPVADKEETLKQGRPIHKEVAYVMIMVPGDKGQVVRRPIRTGQDPKHDNNRFHNEYVAFLQNKDAPIEGMLLQHWNELNTAQVMDLQHIGIKTVEHLADLNDNVMQKYMGLSDLKTRAKKHLAATNRGASKKVLEAELGKRDNEIETLKQALAEQGEAIAELRKGN